MYAPQERVSGPFNPGEAGDGREVHRKLQESAWRGIRTQRYMYARRETGPGYYTISKMIPSRMHNLVNDPAASTVMRELDKELLDWMGERPTMTVYGR